MGPSQRTLPSGSGDRAIRFSGFFSVRNPWVRSLEISLVKYTNPMDPMGLEKSKQRGQSDPQVLEANVTSKATLCGWKP